VDDRHDSWKTRVLLADDHPIVRLGVAALINEEPDLMVCGEAGEISAALELMQTANPDLAIVDLALRDRDGMELINEIHSRHPDIRILVLSPLAPPSRKPENDPCCQRGFFWCSG
jgi:DNA-binding NarL/FixJ family response regulator